MPTTNEDSSDQKDDRESVSVERAAFNAIADAMESLSAGTRIKVLRAIITLFEIPLKSGIDPQSVLATQTVDNSSQTAFSENRDFSPKQFMLEKRPQTDIERVTCLAYYLCHYRGIQHFKTLDISKLNTEAAQIKFANASKAVDNAEAAGLLVRVGQGKVQISAIGEVYVEALPDRTAAKEAAAHARPRRRGKSKTSAKVNDGNGDT